jgi:hypothetical protein
VRKRYAVCVGGIGSLALATAVCSSALAQQGTTPAKKGPETEQVVITPGSEQQQSRVRRFLDGLRGKKTEPSGTPDTEVVTVPKGKLEWVEKRLQALGAKVTRLKENWNHILTRRKQDAPLTPEQKAAVDNAAKSPETLKVGVLQMQNKEIAKVALTRFEQSVGTAGRAGPADDPYAKVVLPLGESSHIVLVRKFPPDFTAGGVTWVGETEETGERAVLMLWKDGHLSGYFGYKGRVFTVNHVGGDIHTMTEIDPRKLPPDHAPDPSQRDKSVAPPAPAAIPTPPPEPVVAPFPDEQRLALEAKKITVDVMLLISKKVAETYIKNPADLAVLSIEQANQTFRNSGLGNITLRLVHTQVVDYDETGADLFDHLFRMVDGVGVFKEMKTLRNEKKADIVGLVLDSPTGCGQSTRVGAEADEAFFVVHHACAAITYSIAHEIGHIFGTRHDRVMDANDSPFAFAHGYINGTKWRDMMSYQEGCGGCPRIPFWSNPRVLYQGEPTGTAAADNARLILEQAERVSKFR